MADNAMYKKTNVAGFLNNAANTVANNTQDAVNQAIANLKVQGTSGGGGSKPSGSSTVASGADYGSYLNSLLAQRQAAVESAYNNAIGRINDAYNSAANSFGNIYNRGVDTLKGSYTNSQNKINEQAQDSMQEAYVNKMKSMKNLSQQLAAMGMSGGASESATAGLINNYGNARNGIQKTWNNNLSDLENTFNTNLNDLYSAYQSQMAQLANMRAQQINQAEMNRANMISDSSGGLYQALLSMSPATLQKALTGAVDNQNAYTPVATEATNVVNPVNTQQVSDMGGNLTNWEAWKQYIDGAGSSTDEKATLMLSAGIAPDMVYKLINGVNDRFGL